MDDCGLELVLKPKVGAQFTGTNASTCSFITGSLRNGGLERRQRSSIENVFLVSDKSMISYILRAAIDR